MKKQFQFQIGAIGRKCSATVIGANRGFNSRLVRLVEKSLIWTVNPSTTFQFQIGAIGRKRAENDKKEVTRFQFQIGAIGSFGICFNF